MTMREAAQEAVTEGNAQLAGKVADVLRSVYGMNYQESAEWFEKVAGCTAEEFEALMYRADLGY